MANDSRFPSLDAPVSMIMEKHVILVGLDDTLDRLEELFASTRLRCIPVMDDDGECFGVVSASDMVRLRRWVTRLKARRAWEICTRPVVSIDHQAPIREAASLMVSNDIHHLIAAGGPRILGIVSLADIVRRCLLLNDHGRQAYSGE